MFLYSDSSLVAQTSQKIPLSKQRLNPFPHIDAFLCLCSRRLFEKIETKEETAQNDQFLPPLVIGYHSVIEVFLFVYKICSMSSASELLQILIIYSSSLLGRHNPVSQILYIL